MENLMMSLEVVMPLIVYMVVGALIRKAGYMKEDQFKALNNVIFKVFIPLALFSDIYSVDLGETLQPDLVAYIVATILLIFLIGYFLFPKLISDTRDATTVTQSLFRSNYVLFGTSIAFSLGGDAAVAQVSAFAAIVVPIFNALCVILFETRSGKKVLPFEIFLNILKNPIVKAGILGGLINISGIRLPEMIIDPIIILGDIASPIALVTLGGMLSLGSMVSHRGYLTMAVIGRLVIVPTAALTLFSLLGYRGTVLVMILAMFGSPTAVASAPMAQAMGGNGKLAGEIVAVTTVFSVLSIFMLVFVMYSLGLI